MEYILYIINVHFLKLEYNDQVLVGARELWTHDVFLQYRGVLLADRKDPLPR